MLLFIFLFLAIIIWPIILSIRDSHDKHTTSSNSSSYDVAHKNLTEPKNNINFNVSYEFKKIEKEYPLYDATKIPVKRYYVYKVKGKNPKTNRLKTNNVVVLPDTSEDIIIQKSGLLDPYTVSRYFNEPSEAQINYAKDINIIYPSDCTSEDISCLLSRQLAGDYKDYINSNLLEYAAANNIYVSSYAWDTSGAVQIISRLPPTDRIAFFVYIIYCHLKNIKIGNMYQLSNYSIFYDYTNTISNIDEVGKLIKEHPYKTVNEGGVDRRNKNMAQLYDSICQYINSLI